MDGNSGNITATILVGQKIFASALYDPKYPVDTRALILPGTVSGASRDHKIPGSGRVYLEMKAVRCYVGKNDCDVDGVANAKALAGPHTEDPVPLFLETVIIVSEAGDQDKPFHEYAGKFHEETE